MSTVAIQRAEGAAIALVAAAAFVQGGFAWWWLLVLFLAFDVSAAGYLAGPRIGAAAYNAVHALVGPALVAAAALVLDGASWALFLAPLWAFHVGVDRALGYGLKEATSFHDTHLGRVGRTPT